MLVNAFARLANAFARLVRLATSARLANELCLANEPFAMLGRPQVRCTASPGSIRTGGATSIAKERSGFRKTAWLGVRKFPLSSPVSIGKSREQQWCDQGAYHAIHPPRPPERWPPKQGLAIPTLLNVLNATIGSDTHH